MYRRKGFYQRRGYKLAVTRYRASGVFTRTYKFYCNPFLIFGDNFQPVEYTWTAGNPPNYIGNYLPVSFSRISYETLVNLSRNNYNSQAKQFTGPCNMYGVYNLPLEMSRVLGYREYTVINLSQVGMFWLMWNNNFINQRELIKEDLKKYSYYRALSVTVKFAPRYASIPGKISGFAPTTINLPSYQIPSDGLKIIPDVKALGAWSGGSTVAAGGSWAQTNVQEFANENAITANASSAASFGPPTPVSAWDDDAYTLIGYLIPGSPSETTGNATTTYPGWSACTFGRVIDYPGLQWLSSFRKAGYPRSYISRNKPTSFKFLLPQGPITPQLNLPPNDSPSAHQLYGYYSTSGGSQNSPFTAHKECIKPGLMNAEMLELLPWIDPQRTTSRQINFPKYWNPANCNLFIPGVTPDHLLNRYKVSFSYKFQYYSRVYDDN